MCKLAGRTFPIT